MAGYSVTFSVVDHASKEIDAINRRLAAIRAPIERMSRSISRFVDVSGLRKVAQGFEWIGKAASSVLRTMVEIVPVLGTITGAATLVGMANLVKSYASWSRELTATADGLGMTTRQVQQFEDAMRLAGGEATDMDAALKGLYKNATDFVRGQASTDTVGWLNRLGISVRDSTGHLRNMNELMPEVIRKISQIENPADRAAAAAALLGESGNKVVEGFRQSSKGFEGFFRDATRYQELTDEQRKQLELFSEAQGRIGTAFDHLGQQISATLAKNFTPLLNHLSEFVEKNTPAIITAVDDISRRFASWLENVDWSKVQDGVQSLIDGLKWVVTHLGEIKTAAEIVAGIFITKWGIGVVAAIGQVVAALGSIGGGAAGAGAAGVGGVGLLGALGAVAGIAAALAALAATAYFNKQGQEEIKAGAAKEGFTEYDSGGWTGTPSFRNPQTGETRTWVEQMQRQGKAPADLDKEGYSPAQRWIRRQLGLDSSPSTPSPPPAPSPPSGVELPSEQYTPGGAWGKAGPAPASPQLATVTSRNGQAWSVAAEYKDRFQGLVDELDARGVKLTSGGGYNRRPIRGTTDEWSAHAFGGAVDINAATNPMGGKGTDMPADIADIASRHGLYWGGRFHGKSYDPMHFEVESAANQAADEAARRTYLAEHPAAVAPPPGPTQVAGVETGWQANNPLNLTRKPGEGGSTTPGGLPIRTFATMEEGVQASVAKLVEYQQKRHLMTVDAMAREWNKTSTPDYIKKIADSIGVKPTDQIDITDPKVAAAWMRAAQPQETGPGRLTEAQIGKGVALALPDKQINGTVDIAITHKNPPPNAAVTASGSGAVTVQPPKVEHQELATI